MCRADRSFRQDTQGFFNASIEYLDRLDYVQRYAWFGSFRSDVSNVGPNGAMLNSQGQLNYLGAWYLGRPVTEKTPNGGGGPVRPSFSWCWWSMGWGVAVMVVMTTL